MWYRIQKWCACGCCCYGKRRRCCYLSIVGIFVTLSMLFAIIASLYTAQHANKWYPAQCYIEKAEYMQIYHIREKKGIQYSINNENLQQQYNYIGGGVGGEVIMGWVYTVNTTFYYHGEYGNEYFDINGKICEPGTTVKDRKHTGLQHPCMLLINYYPPINPSLSITVENGDRGEDSDNNHNNTQEKPISTVNDFIVESIFWTNFADLLLFDNHKIDDNVKFFFVISLWILAIFSLVIFVYSCQVVTNKSDSSIIYETMADLDSEWMNDDDDKIINDAHHTD